MIILIKSFISSYQALVNGCIEGLELKISAGTMRKSKVLLDGLAMLKRIRTLATIKCEPTSPVKDEPTSPVKAEPTSPVRSEPSSGRQPCTVFGATTLRF